MRAVVIYESMYGNTQQIAEAIAQGLNLPDVVLPEGLGTSGLGNGPSNAS